MKASKRFQLNELDYKKILNNALIFVAPALLVLLGDLVKAFPDWFSGSYLVIALWVVNIVTDALRKFIAGK
jgi:hypothetical protein